jgi:hypothetical protein
MKKVILSLVLLMAVALTGSAVADTIGFHGVAIATQLGSAGSPQVGFSFSNVTVGTPVADTLNGASIVLNTGGAVFNNLVTTTVGSFSGGPGSFNILDNGGSGSLTSNVDYVNIISTVGVPGAYTVTIKLSNINVSVGTSTALNGFVGVPGGAGFLTFNFTAPDNTSLYDFLNMGISDSGSTIVDSSLSDTFSGTVRPVPEPSSVALLGSGLLGLGSMLRRKFKV